MLLRLPAKRLFLGRKGKSKDKVAAEDVSQAATPARAPSRSVAAPVSSQVAQAPVQEPEVLLPGVPEAVAVGSRWQPLFRDPTFGGSIEPKARHFKQLQQQRSFVFEDEAEHLIEKKRSKEGPVASTSGRLREVWKIVVQHKDETEDPGSPTTPTTPTGPSPGPSPKSPKSPGLSEGSLGSPRRGVWDLARQMSKRSTNSAFSNVSSSSSFAPRFNWPSEDEGKRPSWPSEESTKKKPSWPSEESSKGRHRASSSSGLSGFSGRSEGSEAQEVAGPTDLEEDASLVRRTSSGSQLLPTFPKSVSPKVRTPRSPKSPKSPLASPKSPSASPATQRALAGALRNLSPGDALEAPRLAALAYSLGTSLKALDGDKVMDLKETDLKDASRLTRVVEEMDSKGKGPTHGETTTQVVGRCEDLLE